MTHREAYRAQLKEYRKDLEHWQKQPVTQASTHEVNRLLRQIERHQYPENKPK